METPPPFSPTSPPIIGPQGVAVMPRGSDKLWSILCHLSWILGVGYFVLPLIVYLVFKHESEYVTANAREALNFHISTTLYSICCIPLLFLFGLGFFVWVMIAVCFVIFSIIAAVKASDGGCYHYPLTIRLIQ